MYVKIKGGKQKRCLLNGKYIYIAQITKKFYAIKVIKQMHIH